MSSCAASCCTCFPKASCAFGTSDSWPTAARHAPCHFAFILLGSAPQTEPEHRRRQDSSDLWLCPKCGGPMVVIERLTACRNPTSFSTRPGHGCRMKRLSTTRNLCVSRHAQSLLRLLAPQTSSSRSSRSSTDSQLAFANHYSSLHSRLSCSVAQLRPTSTPHLPLHSIPIGPASAATTGGPVQTALSNARRAPRLPSPLRENARPIKH